MKAIVKGLVAIEKAELDLDGLTLIVAENEAGKTTLAEAIGAALCADPRMRGITTLNKLPAVLRRGHDAGMVFLVDGAGGSVELTYPEGKFQTKGEKPPHASAIAVGRVKPMQLASDERTKLLVTAMKAHPTLADMKAALTAQHIPADVQTEVIESLKKNGWGAAERFYREQTARHKGAWEEITGDNYGPVKAQGWRPDTWTPDLDDEEEADLERALAATREFLEEVIASRAVDDSDMEAWRAEAARMPELAEAIKAEDAKMEQADIALIDLRKALAALPQHEVKGGFECPHGCPGKRIDVRDTLAGKMLVAVTEEKLTKKELKKRREDFASAQAKVQHQEALKRTAGNEILRLEEQIRVCKNAQDKLTVAESKRRKQGESQESEEAEADARQQVAAAEAALAAFRTKRAADAKQRSIVIGLALIEILKPDGLRQQKLSTTLSAFCKENLAPLAEAMELEPITLHPDLSLDLGDTPYALLSQGARYAVDAVLQVALARIDGSDLIILDGADILVGDRRANLLKMLAIAKVRALICMATTLDAKVPPLEKMGYGRVYRLSDGTAAKDAA